MEVWGPLAELSPERVVLVDADNQSHVLEQLLDDRSYHESATGLVLFASLATWYAHAPALPSSSSEPPKGVLFGSERGWVCAVVVEGETKDATDVELAMQAVHMHYALEPGVTFVVASQDGFASQVCAHMETLGREVSLVPVWHAGRLDSDSSSKSATDVDAREFLSFVARAAEGKSGSNGWVPRSVLGAMFKDAYTRDHHARIFRKLVNDVLTLRWAETDSSKNKISLTKRGRAALLHATRDQQDNSAFVRSLVLELTDSEDAVPLGTLGLAVKARKRRQYSAALFRLLVADAVSVGTVEQTGRGPSSAIRILM